MYNVICLGGPKHKWAALVDRIEDKYVYEWSSFDPYTQEYCYNRNVVPQLEITEKIETYKLSAYTYIYVKDIDPHDTRTYSFYKIKYFIYAHENLNEQQINDLFHENEEWIMNNTYYENLEYDLGDLRYYDDLIKFNTSRGEGNKSKIKRIVIKDKYFEM